MLLIPAIDLKEGQCVRLRQGDMDRTTVFSDDPLAAAERWISEGARRLHIVDLDGAVKGEPVNAGIIHRIAERHPEVPVQVGGGIRNEDTVKVYLQAGVRSVIIGTRAVKDPDFIRALCAEYPGRIIVGLDARDGKIATEGWAKLSGHQAVDMARQFDAEGVEAIVYTDIARDGMMQGVNIAATVALAESVKVPVIASGGIHNLDNVIRLAEASGSGIAGAITGRAIYEGTLDFAAGQKAADEVSGRRSAGR
ncbi:MAG: 1-(5-phosphoribosyl)-5-[(5-phosphoribosylamino)methylideneamino]imidazole-4-carboxamide isomerase [Gammaproteobacteria bacterium]|nr:1-(5-phosphoribosyl)-5-[(5-phosphoribosylamino)methylideneamino]imidazole-4-carboxamide isomerase [Gammaproteobacteria bacterium]